MAQALLAVPTQDFLQKTLGAALSAGVTASATLNNVTGIQNLPGVFIVDRVDANGTETPNAVEVVKYTATSGSTVTTLTRGLAGTSDQDHAISAIVEFVPDIIWAQAVYDALTQVVVASTGVIDTTKVVTPTGTQTLTNKTLTTPQINDTSSDHQYVFAASELEADRTVTLPLLTGADTFVFQDHAQTLSNKTIKLTAAPSVDHSASGITIALTANENQAFGDVCRINSDGEAQLVDADAIATSDAVVMCADATISADASGNYLVMGIARDDTWAWTVGGKIYITVTGTTGNTLSQTAPSATDDVIQIAGVATHADRMLFNPQLVQVEHV